MKATFSLIFTITLLLILSGLEVCKGQTVAIGHVTAEVIQSVSATSHAITTLSLENRIRSAAATTTTPTVDLGSMTVNSGSSAAVNVVLKAAILSDAQGKGFTIDPTLTANTTTSVASSNGSQNIKIRGIANIGTGQASGLYQGSYTVVFAYN